MQKREPISFSINKRIFKKFKDCCKDKHVNRSDLVESFIKKYLEENGKEK